MILLCMYTYDLQSLIRELPNNLIMKRIIKYNPKLPLSDHDNEHCLKEV